MWLRTPERYGLAVYKAASFLRPACLYALLTRWQTLAGPRSRPKRNDGFGVCAGAPVQPFERRLSEQIRWFAFDGAMLEPFLRLWQSGDRPDMPLSPESVIVYAAPGKPYVVGYERQGCMIAFLAVTHHELWRWLRPSVGWLAEGPGTPVTRAKA